MSDDRREHGMRIRREVLGDDHVDRVMAETTERTAAFQDLITRYAWGEIWARPGLVAHGHFEELAMHVRAARRNGMTPEEIEEVLLQCAIYCGVPAANQAFKVLGSVLAESE